MSPDQQALATPSPARRVLLIGWDAADWKMIHPLLDAGKLPTLARFLSQGVMGNLATLQPILSPMLWTSIATGKRAYNHGIFGFTEPDPVTGAIRPVTNLSRTTKALWNIANQSGLHSINVGWWPSHPAEPLSRGVMVSNHYQRATGPEDNWPMMAGTVHPPRLTELLAGLRFHPNELDAEVFATFLPALQGMDPEQLAAVEQDPRLKMLAKIIADATSVQSAATALLQNEPWTLACVYFDAIDHFGHGFMRYHPLRQPQIGEADFAIYKDVVESGYRFQDMQLAALLALVGDDTLVMLCSDHGFHPDHLRPRHIPVEPAGPAAEHRPFGIFAARGPGLRQDAVIHGASLLDICPTVLHSLGLPVGEDMEGKVLLDIYDERSRPVLEVRRIPSWDLVEGDAGLHPVERQISPEEAKQALDQLVALGYIDAPGEDQTQALDRTVRELDYNKAQSLLDGGRSTDAAVILERLYARWPGEHRFGIKLSTCYRNLKRTDNVRRVVAQIRERRLADAEQAVAELKARGLDSSEGIADYRAEIEALPEGERETKAKEVQRQFARARPNLTALRFLEASASLADGRLDDALTQLAEIEGPATDPDGIPSPDGTPDDAPAATTSATAKSRRPLPINALLLRGEIRLRRRDYREALADYARVNDYDDEHPVARLGMARAHLGLGRYDEAALWAAGSIALVFNQPWAHYLHGVALLRGGRWQEAEPVFALAARFQALAPAAYRMLMRIARQRREDVALTTQYRLALIEARRRMRAERERLAAAAEAAAADTEVALPAFPELPGSLGDDTPTEAIITVVSGLPRSGTSLMMQMLAAAGIPAFTDDARGADASNPKGYFEHARVAGLPREQDFSWLLGARGRAIKVVAPLLPFLPAAVHGQPLHYRVIFMQRPMPEIIASQAAMLARLGKAGASADIARAYRQQTLAAHAWLRQLAAAGQLAGLDLDYRTLVADAETYAGRTAGFIRRIASAPAMAAAVDGALYRIRKDPAQTPAPNREGADEPNDCAPSHTPTQAPAPAPAPAPATNKPKRIDP